MKRRTVIQAGLLMAILMLFNVQATAAIVYVDATDGASGNTTLVGGGQWDPLTADQGVADDGVWAVRTTFANNGTIYQNSPSGSVDNAHRLQTNVSGLATGTYNVFAYYWSDTSNWRVEASLTDNPGGDLPLFIFQPLTPGVVQHWTGADGTVLSSSLPTNPFTSDVTIAEGNRRLLQAPLGQVTGTGFTVYIDDSSVQASQDERTWYDGVGYARVPEPTSCALVGLVLGVLAVGRRALAAD